ncbi:phage portal protein [Streptomyces sp. NPDC054887]
MASRRFLPALRSLIAGSPPPAETKTISWSSGAYPTPYSGTSNVWRTEGRADGWDMDRVITEGYERVVWVFKAVDTIGKHASRLPLELGRGLTEEGEFEETFPDHPLLRLLNGQANPLETGQMFRKRLSAQILLSKRGAFVEKTRSRAGTLTRVDLLPPDRGRSLIRTVTTSPTSSSRPAKALFVSSHLIACCGSETLTRRIRSAASHRWRPPASASTWITCRASTT